MIIPEKYTLGFKIDGHDIPDPSEFKYNTASVDVSAERNTSGLLAVRWWRSSTMSASHGTP